MSIKDLEERHKFSPNLPDNQEIKSKTINIVAHSSQV